MLSSPAPAMIHCDARGGIAHHGFDLAFADLATRARRYGVALFAGHRGFTTGELGDYASRLAEFGLVAFAATNGPALVAPPGARRALYCTNPFAFAAPADPGPALLIDQATSATAFVNVRAAAERGEELPAGIAIDEDAARRATRARRCAAPC